MKDQVEGYSLKIIEADNKTDEINGEAISMTYKKDDSVKDALKNQNPLLWIRALFSKSSAEVTINVVYNEDALSKSNRVDSGSESRADGTGICIS